MTKQYRARIYASPHACGSPATFITIETTTHLFSCRGCGEKGHSVAEVRNAANLRAQGLGKAADQFAKGKLVDPRTGLRYTSKVLPKMQDRSKRLL